MKKVADNIRQARLEKNYTQEYLAKQLKISRHAYCNIELGQVDINTKRLRDIAAILERRPEELITSSMHPAEKETFAIRSGNGAITLNESTIKELTSVLTELCVLLKMATAT